MIENGLFGTVNNKYAIFDDSRFTDGSYTMNVYNDIYGVGILGTGVYLDKDGCLHPHTQHYRKRILLF